MIICICTKMLKVAFHIRIQNCECCNTFRFDSCDMFDFKIEFLCGYSFPIQPVSFLDSRLHIHANVRQIRLNCFKTVLTFLICKYSCQANMHVGTLIQILDQNIFTTIEKQSNQFSNKNVYAHVTSYVYINHYILF